MNNYDPITYAYGSLIKYRDKQTSMRLINSLDQNHDMNNGVVLEVNHYSSTGLIFWDYENYSDYIIGETVLIKFGDNGNECEWPITRHHSGVSKINVIDNLDIYLIKDIANLVDGYIHRKFCYSISFDVGKISNLLYAQKILCASKHYFNIF